MQASCPCALPKVVEVVHVVVVLSQLKSAMIQVDQLQPVVLNQLKPAVVQVDLLQPVIVVVVHVEVVRLPPAIVVQPLLTQIQTIQQ